MSQGQPAPASSSSRVPSNPVDTVHAMDASGIELTVLADQIVSWIQGRADRLWVINLDKVLVLHPAFKHRHGKDRSLVRDFLSGVLIYHNLEASLDQQVTFMKMSVPTLH